VPEASPRLIAELVVTYPSPRLGPTVLVRNETHWV
jgi:hypothetical protein